MNRKLLLFLMLCMLIGHTCLAQTCDELVPKRPGYFTPVMDYASVLSGTEKAALTATIKDYETRTGGTQIQVVILDDIGDCDVFDVTRAIFKAWEPGSKQYDDGVLFFTAVKNKEFRIMTGYGMEWTLTDGICRRILESDEVLGRMKRDETQLPAAIQSAVEQIIVIAGDEKQEERAQERQRLQERHDRIMDEFFKKTLPGIVLFILLIVVIVYTIRYLKRVSHAARMLRENKRAVREIQNNESGLVAMAKTHVLNYGNPLWASEGLYQINQTRNKALKSFWDHASSLSPFSANETDLDTLYGLKAGVDECFKALKEFPGMISAKVAKAIKAYSDLLATCKEYQDLHASMTAGGFYLPVYSDEVMFAAQKFRGNSQDIDPATVLHMIVNCANWQDIVQADLGVLQSIQQMYADVATGLTTVPARITAISQGRESTTENLVQLQQLCPQSVYEEFVRLLTLHGYTTELQAIGTECAAIRPDNGHQDGNYTTAFSRWNIVNERIARLEKLYVGVGNNSSWINTNLALQLTAQDECPLALTKMATASTAAIEALDKTGVTVSNYTERMTALATERSRYEIAAKHQKNDWIQLLKDINAVTTGFKAVQSEAEADHRRYKKANEPKPSHTTTTYTIPTGGGGGDDNRTGYGGGDTGGGGAGAGW